MVVVALVVLVIIEELLVDEALLLVAAAVVEEDEVVVVPKIQVGSSICTVTSSRAEQTSSPTTVPLAMAASRS